MCGYTALLFFFIVIVVGLFVLFWSPQIDIHVTCYGTVDDDDDDDEYIDCIYCSSRACVIFQTSQLVGLVQVMIQLSLVKMSVVLYALYK